MLIDWFTVGAQALNFVILVWLMRRFLYKPILHAIDAREKKIAAELADAAAKKAEAEKERDEFQHKNEELDQQRAALLRKATDDAKAERQRLLDEARKAADALSAKRQETLRNDAHNLNQAISRRTQQEVFAIARKALDGSRHDEPGRAHGRGVHSPLAARWMARRRHGLAEALKTASEPALVRSAFDLPARAARGDTKRAQRRLLGGRPRPVRDRARPRSAGSSSSTNGQKVGWSIADYLDVAGKGRRRAAESKEQRKPPRRLEAATGPKPEANADARSRPDAKPDVEAKSQ